MNIYGNKKANKLFELYNYPCCIYLQLSINTEHEFSAFIAHALSAFMLNSVLSQGLNNIFFR